MGARARGALVAAASLAALMACIEVDGDVGKRCTTANDCSEGLVCVAARPGQGRTCEALALPPVRQDTPPDGGEPTVFWCGEVEPLMIAYCASCHGEDRSASGNLPFRLDVYHDLPDAGLQGAFSKADRIKVRTTDFRNMPPPGSPMPTDEERALIGDWVVGGAPLCPPGGLDGGTADGG